MKGERFLLRSTNWIAALIVAATFVVLYWNFRYSAGYLDERVSILRTVTGLWGSYPDWQHGALVPLIAGFIIWTRRKQLRTIPIQGSWMGLPVLLVSFFLYWLGYLIDHYYLGFAAAQTFLAGIIIWLLGWRMMGALAFPWLFLSFTWPILYFDNLIAFPLRILMTEMSYSCLTGLGVPCVRSGSAILSAPDYMIAEPAGARFAVDIADPCSGIHSLFALMMVSAVYGYFTLPKVSQRIVIFLAAIPFAILGNLTRIMMLTFGTLIFGAPFAIGTEENPSVFHLAAGFFVFVIALMAMLVLGWLLQLDWRVVWSQLQRRRHAFFKPAAAHPRIPAAAEPNSGDLY